MSQLFATLSFFFQPVFDVIGLGYHWFIGGIVIASLLMWLTFPVPVARQRCRFLVLLLFPAIWIFVALWGAGFWRSQAPPNPVWVSYPIVAAPFLMLAISTWLIWSWPGARLFASIFIAMNLYFTLILCIVANAAVSGTWL